MEETGSRGRLPSEVLKRGYTDEEVEQLYELGRLFLESGQLKKGEVVFAGLNAVAPDFEAAWLGTAYVRLLGRDFEEAAVAVRQALRVNPTSTEGTLFLVACLLSTGDLTTAGTLLGEVGEKIEAGVVQNSNLIRFFKIQMARYAGK